MFSRSNKTRNSIRVIEFASESSILEFAEKPQLPAKANGLEGYGQCGSHSPCILSTFIGW